MNYDLIDKIKKAGLTEKESKIYTFLLETGGAFPSKVASATRINRSTTYKTLASLSIKGLVNEIEKKNKLFYQIEKPKRLVKYAENQVKISEENLGYINKIFPELNMMFSKTPNKPKVKFFEGPEAIQIICDEVVSEKNYEMVALSNAEKFKDIYNQKLLREFIKGKERNNIRTRGIIVDTEENRKYNEEVFKGIDKKYWPVMKYINKDVAPFDGEITIFKNNKVSLGKLVNGNIFAVLIEDEMIHKMMKSFFEIAWESKLLKQ